MRPAKDLGKLHRAAERRSLALRRLVESLSPPLVQSDTRVVAFATIEAGNLWSLFCRSFYVSCMLQATRLSGTRVTTTAQIATEVDAILFSVRSTNPGWAKARKLVTPRDEPAWQDLSVLLQLFQNARASNEPQVQAALSNSSRFFDQLSTARNFFAHRGKVTSQKVIAVARSKGVNPALRPSEIMSSRPAGRPNNMITEWLDDVLVAADLMCQ